MENPIPEIEYFPQRIDQINYRNHKGQTTEILRKCFSFNSAIEPILMPVEQSNNTKALDLSSQNSKSLCLTKKLKLSIF